MHDKAPSGFTPVLCPRSPRPAASVLALPDPRRHLAVARSPVWKSGVRLFQFGTPRHHPDRFWLRLFFRAQPAILAEIITELSCRKAARLLRGAPGRDFRWSAAGPGPTLADFMQVYPIRVVPTSAIAVDVVAGLDVGSPAHRLIAGDGPCANQEFQLKLARLCRPISACSRYRRAVGRPASGTPARTIASLILAVFFDSRLPAADAA